MSKQHLYFFIGGAAIGYFMANKLIAYQPWKLTYNLVANL
jgi:hypothetical protein